MPNPLLRLQRKLELRRFGIAVLSAKIAQQEEQIAELEAQKCDCEGCGCEGRLGPNPEIDMKC